MISKRFGVLMLATAPVFVTGLPIAAAESGVSAVPFEFTGRNGAQVDDAAAAEREQRTRLRRAREAHESQRTQQALRRETELTRQNGISRLQMDLLRDERTESSLRHEMWQTQNAVRTPPPDPADHASIARRAAQERHLLDHERELHRTVNARDDAQRRLQGLKPR